MEPKKRKYKKSFRGNMRGKAKKGTTLFFGDYGLQACEPSWITQKQIEAGRRCLSRHSKRGGKIWIRIFPDRPVSARSEGTRMGSGKGSVEFWVSTVKPNKILYEIKGVSKEVALKALKSASFKMPMKTRIVEIDSTKI